MWRWPKRSPFKGLKLPKKLFISHSYKDAGSRERLLKLLPRSVEPFIFPPIVVSPEKMVSDNLLDAIRDCDGLIYLLGGASSESFWVALERDYALRVGKCVFAFDSQTNQLREDKSPPLDLSVYFSDGGTKTAPILKQRFFDVWTYSTYMPSTHLPNTPMAEENIVRKSIRNATEVGGYVVIFWDGDASGLSRYSQMAIEESQNKGRPVLLVRTDPSEYPQLGEHSIVVQLFGDAQRSQTQRADDLIVLLYWLIYRNTRQNQLE